MKKVMKKGWIASHKVDVTQKRGLSKRFVDSKR